jgi:hypothetical protein
VIDTCLSLYELKANRNQQVRNCVARPTEEWAEPKLGISLRVDFSAARVNFSEALNAQYLIFVDPCGRWRTNEWDLQPDFLLLGAGGACPLIWFSGLEHSP